MNEFPQLETDRLILREPQLSDADDVYDYMRRGSVQTFIPNIPVEYTRENAKEYLESVKDELNLEEKIVWGITHRSDSKLIGMANIHDINERNKQGSLGYALNPEYQNNGYMTEAVTAIIDYAFTDYTFDDNNIFHRVEAEVAAENKPSRSLLTDKLGFTEEGKHRDKINIRGHYHDAYTYGLLREDWQ